MSISDRYRVLSTEVGNLFRSRTRDINDESDKPLRDAKKAMKKADAVLAELQESVGEIPRIRLEGELTPVLLKGHNNLDRARLDFIEAGRDDIAEEVWALQQTIYRLLNDL